MTRCSGGEPNRVDKGNVKLSWGEGPDGRMLHVAQVPSGLACGCICPGCGEKLVAKKGKRKIATRSRKQTEHFAHYSSHGCHTALESMLHKLAKQVIADRKVVRTPAVIAGCCGEKRLISRATDFRLNEVIPEPWLDGIRPDIVARRTKDGISHDLLVEIKVAHACSQEKIARIRERRIAAIEIDLSKVPRHACQQEMENAIFLAPREWLFNARAEAAIEKMRLEAERRDAFARKQEERRRQREEVKLKLNADRLAAAFRRMRTAGQYPTQLGREYFARVRDAGLDGHVGLEIVGNACFTVSSLEWQAAVIDRFAIGKHVWYASGVFDTAEVVKFLRERRFIQPDFPVSIGETLASAVRSVAPDFHSPPEAVDAYLELLVQRGMLRRHGRDWYRNEGLSENARNRIWQAIEGRDRSADLERKLRELLEVLPQGHKVDVRRWLETFHCGLVGTPLAIAAEGGWGYTKLLNHMDRLKAMLRPGAAVEENLLELPLDEHLMDRQEERRRAKEEQVRQAAEAERKAAEDVRLAAEQRRSAIAEHAVAYLGYDEGTAWLSQSLRSLGGVPVDSFDTLTEVQYAAASRELSVEHDHRLSEAARLHAIREVQELLRAEAGSHGDPDWVNFWMRSRNRLLGSRRPLDVCVDQAGLEECRKALRHEPWRLRGA